MLISIIIPTLDEEAYLPDLLSFFLKHPNKKQFQVIIVDGGSRDHTLEIAKNAGCIIVNTSISSRAHQMNEGAKVAEGEILYFVHADTRPVDSFAIDIADAVNKGYASGSFICKFFDHKQPLLRINAWFTRFPFLWCRGGEQSLFMIRDHFEQIGGFNENFVIMEDYDILNRIYQHSRFLIIKKNILVSARKYKKNTYLKVQFANLKAMRMFCSGEAPEAIRKFYQNALD